MKHRKKIDDLYRERLRNVETPPPADSWEYISSHLPAEKKSRVFPLWYKLAGAAAVLLLAVTLFNLNDFNVKDSEEIQITDNPADPDKSSNNAATVFEEPEEADSPASQRPSSGTAGSTPGKDQSTTETRTAEVPSEANKDSKITNPATTAVAVDETGTRTVVEERRESEEAITESKIQTVPSHSQNTAIAEEETQSSDRQVAPIKADGIIQENLFEEEVAAATEDQAGFLKRIRISTTAAAVFFDNLGSGNTLDDQLAESGGGEVSMSYGINLAYQVTDKVKLRSGINKVNLNYNVPNVDYAAAMRSEAIDQDPAASGTILSYAPGSIAQEMGFIEVPLEVEYSLIDKKIGLNLVAGASTLFLENNNLSLNASGLTTDLGEAQNLNNLSFSANLGLGLHYNLSPQFRLNLEPIFKYQINTFNNISGLRPYYFGIYSGVSFGF